MRHIVVTAACIAAAVTLVLAACGQAPASRPELTASRGAAAATGGTGPSQPIATGLIDLTGAGSGVVGLFVGSGSGRSVHLVATSDDGHKFRPLGPLASNDTVPESVSFVGHEDGWMTSYNVATVDETLYRTQNGGRSWQAFAEGSHSAGGGSQDSVQFISPSAGWLTATQPNAPTQFLEHTSDGGIHWRCVASLRSSDRTVCPGVLPGLAPITFEPDGKTGWLGGGLFSSALYRSRDGGRSWHRMAIPSPAGATFGPPAMLGQAIIEIAVFQAGNGYTMATYTSLDNGAHWRLAGTLAGAATGSECLGPMSDSFPSVRVGWAAAFRNGRVAVYRSTDGGGRWTALPVPAGAPHGSCVGSQIQAVSSTQAWLVVPADSGSAIYTTVNAGRSWQRIDEAAEAGA